MKTLFNSFIALLLVFVFTQAGFGQIREAEPQGEKFHFIQDNSVKPDYDADNDPFFTPKLNLYPNPVQNTLYYKFDRTLNQDVEITVLNALGQVMRSKMTNALSGGIDMSDLENGVYLIKVDNGREARTYKVTKNL